MIICWRTVHVPQVERKRFTAWIEKNRRLREEHGILFEFVLQRSVWQSPAKTLQPSDLESGDEADLVVVTAWASHEAFDAWIATPDRDRLTDSDVHRSVEYRPITRFDMVGGYTNLDGLSAVAESPKEES
jgi:hypothetical protein